MSDAVRELQQRIGHTFRDAALLRCALTHVSYASEHPAEGESNQRLEFLGDAVLHLVIGEALFELYPGEREGPLSRRRALLVNRAFLARLAREIRLERGLRLGASEESADGRNRTSTLGDGFEALVGAVYREIGFEATRRLVLALYGPLPARLAAFEDSENPKGRLQELVQPRHGNHAIRYEVVGTTGEDHARAYEVAVFVLFRECGRGTGTSKKLAEEAAARAALAGLRPDDAAV
jgi:ribonuclease-3